MDITYKQLCSPQHFKAPSDQSQQVDEAIKIILGMFPKTPGLGRLVFAWDDLDPFLQSIFNWNGGDEDWVVFCKEEFEYVPNWLEAMGICGLDTYTLPGLVVYVASHA